MRCRRLILLRHGETDYNAGNRMQGQLDTELTARGQDQALHVARALANRRPLLIVSSDLRRARATARALGERTGAPVLIDPRLREMHLGDWQGLTENDIDAAEPGSRLTWQGDPNWAGHGGESRVDVAARAIPIVSELVAAQGDWGIHESARPIVLATHNAVITALTARLSALPVDYWPVLGGLSNGSWVELSGRSDRSNSTLADIRWRLDVWNASADVASDAV